MASAAFSEEGDEHECPVCHEYFSQPKILTCGHLLCRRCLISWLQTQTDAGCPLCRCVIVDPEEKGNGKTSEDLADTFPTDLSMEAWVESQQLLSKDHECQACVTQTATSICTTCRDLFCANCAIRHMEISVPRHHSVEELTSLTPEKLASSRRSFCSTHGDKICEVYCPNHGVSVCLLCATTEHQQCPERISLDTRLEEARAVLADMSSKLRAKEAHLEQAVQQLDRYLQDMEQKVKVTTGEIEAMCDHLESAIKVCRQRLKDLLHDACDEVKEAVEEAKTCLRQRQGKLTVHNRVVQRAERGTTAGVVHDMASSLKTRVDRLQYSSTLPSNARVIYAVNLEIDQEAVARVERELLQLGQLKVIPADLLAQPVKPAPLTFHDQKKGGDIVLSNNQQTAERTGILGSDGIVLSCEPMQVNCLYQVRVEKTDSWGDYSDIYLGVVTQKPDTITLPSWSGQLTSAVVVHHDWVMVNGIQIASQVGSSLRNVREGGCVGLMVNRNRTLHLYKDGQCLGVVVPEVADPCYFMMDLCWTWQKGPPQHQQSREQFDTGRGRTSFRPGVRSRGATRGSSSSQHSGDSTASRAHAPNPLN